MLQTIPRSSNCATGRRIEIRALKPMDRMAESAFDVVLKVREKSMRRRALAGSGLAPAQADAPGTTRRACTMLREP